MLYGPTVLCGRLSVVFLALSILEGQNDYRTLTMMKYGQPFTAAVEANISVKSYFNFG